uniref:G-protein coupled receptors family 3 profile domain-containing protein n=1 Tax=Biomphalaria glabrata TaxID=6526 RepID=A0A2C9JQY9_BIOGL
MSSRSELMIFSTFPALTASMYAMKQGHLQALTTSFLFLLLSSIYPAMSQYSFGDAILPGLSQGAYVKNGDLNLGTFLGIYTSLSSTSFKCDVFTLTESTLQKMEAIAYAVELTNNSSTILPNVSLGFVILDECGHPNTVLAQSLNFLPKLKNSSSVGSGGTTYDVVGVVSPSRSDWTSPISQMYSVAKLPIVGYKTGSDELSDKYKHRYFLRVVPPDKYQVMAMLNFIHKMGWSYISVLYHSGNYGEPPFDTIKQLAPKFGICIASSNKVDELTDMGPVVKDLLDVPRARVVILFTNLPVVVNLFDTIKLFNASGYFIWLGSNAWAGSAVASLQNYAAEIAGSFVFQQIYARVPDFEKFYLSRTPATSSNPWLLSAWESFTNCSWMSSSCQAHRAESLAFGDDNSHVINTVFVFANAIDRLLRDKCPDATGKDARSCITGELLLSYLLNTSLISYTGRIHFDDKGDMTGKYWIKQIIPKDSRGLAEALIATYDIITSQVDYSLSYKISWKYFKTVGRIEPLSSDDDAEMPESVCSRPCGPQELKIPKKLECCWDCRTCRSYERLRHDIASCETCAEFYWPDPKTNYTTCQAIPLSHPSINGTMSIVIIALGILAIMFAIIVFAAYIFLWDVRVIKASSRELSVLQLIAVLLGYVTIICFQNMPTPELCGAIYVMFCLSFSWLYSPLLVKAVRIFRIFQSGSKYNMRPKFVNSKSQIIMATILIFFQIIICIIIFIIYKPSSTLTQPIATDKFVELSCDMTLPGLISFLAYNLVLVSLCSVFAFKTRKLPDNFNESKFMSMCVATTLVIWLAFTPTYLTAIYQYVRVLLLSAALLLNHTVALVFLFIPKIYAGLWIPQEPSVRNVSYRFQTATAKTARTSHQPNINQVGPHSCTEQQRQGF